MLGHLAGESQRDPCPCLHLPIAGIPSMHHRGMLFTHILDIKLRSCASGLPYLTVHVAVAQNVEQNIKGLCDRKAEQRDAHSRRWCMVLSWGSSDV